MILFNAHHKLENNFLYYFFMREAKFYAIQKQPHISLYYIDESKNEMLRVLRCEISCCKLHRLVKRICANVWVVSLIYSLLIL